MSGRDWELFLEDILESIELIGGYVAGMGLESFKNDRKTIDVMLGYDFPVNFRGRAWCRAVLVYNKKRNSCS